MGRMLPAKCQEDALLEIMNAIGQAQDRSRLTMERIADASF